MLYLSLQPLSEINKRLWNGEQIVEMKEESMLTYGQSKASCVSAKRLAVKIYLLASDYVSGITIVDKTTAKS